METVEKTRGIVLRISPWSRTSHIVSWLTPDRGAIATSVKGAVRPKSAFLGQYDKFYTCDILYYARAHGGVHALRETSPLSMRDGLRGRWRETALAGYACLLAESVAPAGAAAGGLFSFLDAFLDDLAAGDATPASMVALEMGVLRHAGLRPDLSGVDPSAPSTRFSVDGGRAGTGAKTVALTPETAAYLSGPCDSGASPTAVAGALGFLGAFTEWHLDVPPELRAGIVETVFRKSGIKEKQ